MSRDPTQAQMETFLRREFGDNLDAFDIAEATYWFASDWHGGQWSNLYAALCSNQFKPGPIATSFDPDSAAAIAYDALEAQFADNATRGKR